MSRGDRRRALSTWVRRFAPAMGALALGSLMAGGAAAASHPDQLAAGGRPTLATTNIPTTLAIDTANTTSTPVVVGQNFKFQVHVTRTLTGNDVSAGAVTFTASPGVTIGCGGSDNLNANGLAKCNFTVSVPGSYTVTAAYGPVTSGSNTFLQSVPATVSATMTVIKGDTKTTMTLPAGNPITGQAFTVSASVAPKGQAAGTPTGNVDIVETSPNSTVLCTITNWTTVNNSCTVSAGLPASASPYTLHAHYLGDTSFNESVSADATLTIDKGDTTTVLHPVPGVVTGQGYRPSVDVTAVSPAVGIPTGTVTITDDNGHTCSAPLDGTGHGVCTTDLPGTTAGNHQLTANYPGDDNFNPSSDTATQVVHKADTTTTVAVTGDFQAGSTLTVHVTVAPVTPGAGTPTGRVRVTDDAGHSCLLTLRGGNAECSIFEDASGPYTFTAHYLGDDNFNPSTGTEAIELDKATCGGLTKHPYCPETNERPGPPALGQAL